MFNRIRNLFNLWKLSETEEKIILQYRFEKESLQSFIARVVTDETNRKFVLFFHPLSDLCYIINPTNWNNMNDHVQQFLGEEYKETAEEKKKRIIVDSYEIKEYISEKLRKNQTYRLYWMNFKISVESIPDSPIFRIQISIYKEFSFEIANKIIYEILEILSELWSVNNSFHKPQINITWKE